MPCSIRSLTFVCALLVPSLGVSAPVNPQNTGNCLAAPTASAPQNSHWYYRTDRTTQSKCWHLGAGDQSLLPSSVQTSRGGAAPSQSSHVRVSEKQTAKLYADFLKWKDGQAEEHR